ncbi:MAG: Fic family protein [Clostridiales Family XIII bacterium]|jgi:Fic family protein|nr:Fic family protein [Clostridiales Family XIII bacterium]
MDYPQLCRLRDELLRKKNQIPKAAFESFDKSFDIEYAHNSTAIEGNTLSLIETKAVLEDNLSVGGKSLREIYEVVNHDKAFSYVKKCIADGKPLDENTVKDIHAVLMENILAGGVYRNVAVRITGAAHKPPAPSEMYSQVKGFFAALPAKHAEMNAVQLAAYTHAEFVKIHPFEDGNGRTSRLIMNYQLMANRFLPVSIAKENRLNYFNALEEYATNGNLQPFTEMIAALESVKLKDYLTLAPPG